jgi:hypothetical protein
MRAHQDKRTDFIYGIFSREDPQAEFEKSLVALRYKV